MNKKPKEYAISVAINHYDTTNESNQQKTSNWYPGKICR